jgi:hypothetical protein
VVRSFTLAYPFRGSLVYTRLPLSWFTRLHSLTIEMSLLPDQTPLTLQLIETIGTDIFRSTMDQRRHLRNTVRQLLVDNADPNAICETGLPVFHTVTDVFVAEALLEFGADPNKLSGNGDFWIEHVKGLIDGSEGLSCKTTRRLSILKLSIEWGFDLFNKNSRGETLLESLVRQNDCVLVNSLSRLVMCNNSIKQSGSFKKIRNIARAILVPAILHVENPLGNVVSAALKFDLYQTEREKYFAFLERAFDTLKMMEESYDSERGKSMFGASKIICLREELGMTLQKGICLNPERMNEIAEYRYEYFIRGKEMLEDIREMQTDTDLSRSRLSILKSKAREIINGRNHILLYSLYKNGVSYTLEMIGETIMPTMSAPDFVRAIRLINRIKDKPYDLSGILKTTPEGVARTIRNVIKSGVELFSFPPRPMHSVYRTLKILSRACCCFIFYTVDPDTFSSMSHYFRPVIDDFPDIKGIESLNRYLEYPIYYCLLNELQKIRCSVPSKTRKYECDFQSLYMDMYFVLRDRIFKWSDDETENKKRESLMHRRMIPTCEILAYNNQPFPSKFIPYIKPLVPNLYPLLDPKYKKIIFTIVLLRTLQGTPLFPIPNELLFHIFSFLPNYSGALTR